MVVAQASEQVQIGAPVGSFPTIPRRSTHEPLNSSCADACAHVNRDCGHRLGAGLTATARYHWMLQRRTLWLCSNCYASGHGSDLRLVQLGLPLNSERM